jgi:uncharacterized OsmC-like protein
MYSAIFVSSNSERQGPYIFLKVNSSYIVSGKTRQQREEKTKKSVSTQCPHSYNLEKG